MTPITPSPISDQAADLLEKAALVCENMACAPQFEPEIQDRMLRAAAKSIRALATAPTTGSAPESEPWEMDWPQYSSSGMGCGLEDRGIHDPYDAMRYGWDEAMEQVACVLVNQTLYASPAASVLSDTELMALIRSVEDKLGIVWFVPDDSETYAWRTTNTNERLKYARALLAASMGGDRA